VNQQLVKPWIVIKVTEVGLVPQVSQALQESMDDQVNTSVYCKHLVDQSFVVSFECVVIS